jgi:hypothetical protein
VQLEAFGYLRDQSQIVRGTIDQRILDPKQQMAEIRIARA